MNNNKPSWLDKHGIAMLRLSLGAVFLWFGVLKFFQDASPAEEIASRTIELVTFRLISPETGLMLLAVIECMIGIGLLTRKYMRYMIPVLYFQMIGAILPLALFPADTWSAPFVPTLLGQYIIKNGVLISAAIVLGTVSKGGKLIADPAVAKKAKNVENQLADNRN